MQLALTMLQQYCSSGFTELDTVGLLIEAFGITAPAFVDDGSPSLGVSVEYIPTNPIDPATAQAVIAELGKFV
jgi:hypothetical protein